jgi:hypothetical protein
VVDFLVCVYDRCLGPLVVCLRRIWVADVGDTLDFATVDRELVRGTSRRGKAILGVLGVLEWKIGLNWLGA